MNHQGTKMLEADRLKLRQFIIEDAHAMFENWASDPEVTKYMLWSHHESIDVTNKVLTDWISHYNENDFYQWAIILKENGDVPIGSIGVIHKDDKIKKTQIGYCIGQEWWRQGITSEALSLIIEYLFNKVGVNRIECRHDPRNINSGKVMLKCGMKYEGTLRESDWNNQGICDASMYAILKKDFNITK